MTSEADRELDHQPGLHGADLAALLGATVAVLLTITFNPGAWGPIATIVGLLLVVMLLAFFWDRRPPAKDWSWSRRLAKIKLLANPEEWRKLLILKTWSKFFAWQRWESFFVGFALSAVMGFVVAIASAQTIQSIWFGDNAPSECRSVAVAQATMAVRDFNDISVTKSNNRNSIKSPLQTLIDNTLQNGDQPLNGVPYVPDIALQYAFYNQYDAAVGNCLAGETFDSLWWAGVSAFVLTLAWWYWAYLKKPRPSSADSGDPLR
jgi:hypothetical protein